MMPPPQEGPWQVDSQQVGVLGQLTVKMMLIKAGLEIATPERDSGIDLVGFAWSEHTARYVMVPFQIKTSRQLAFGVLRKYEAIPHLVMAYVMRVGREDERVYAMTFAEAVEIARAMGWTATPSWARGGYTTTRPSKRLMTLLEDFRVGTADWGRFTRSQVF